MRNRFDYVAKQLGKEALTPSGTTSVHDEIAPETQHADLRHEPDPARSAERRRLGLLGRIASVLCLIEVYGHAPGAEEFRACLAKHIAFWQQRAREARARNRRRRRQQRQLPAPVADPSLWIIAAGSPTTLLGKLGLVPARGWPPGVYFFGDDVLRVGIVVASQLPRTRYTLLVRLMAAGPLLLPALEDLIALPQRAYERAVAEHILVDLERALALQPSRSLEEQEFIVKIRRSFEDFRVEGREEGRVEGREEGRVEGREEGRVEGRVKGRVEGRAEGAAETQAAAVLSVLRVRGIAVTAAARRRILATKNLEKLKRWHERAILAETVDEVLEGRLRRRPTKAAQPAAGRERAARRTSRAAAAR